MKYSMHLTANAQRNVRGILSYLKERSAAGAVTWYRRWMEVIDSLESVAGNCGQAAECNDHLEVDLRQIIFKTKRGLPYRVIFILRDDDCLILHVRGSGQDLIAPDDIKV